MTTEEYIDLFITCYDNKLCSVEAAENQNINIKVSQHYKLWDVDIIATLGPASCSLSFELFKKHSDVNNSHTFIVKTFTVDTEDRLLEIYLTEFEKYGEVFDEIITGWSETLSPKKKES